MRKHVAGLLITTLMGSAARAQFPVAAPILDPFFSSHMVLPRDVPVPITGAADPGGLVDVSFGDARASTRADDRGRFRAVLPAQPVRRHGETLFVRAGQGTARCDDVLVGDVYLCAGQSNMAFELRSSIGAQDELTAALPDDVRLMSWRPRLSTGSARYTLDEVSGHSAETLYVRAPWDRARVDSLASFSAVAWHFGRRVTAGTGIPTGLVAVAVGGSPIEAWLPRAHLATDPETRAFLHDWLSTDSYPPWCRERARQNLAAWLESNPGGPAHHAFEPAILFDAGVAPFAEVPFRAVLWYQGESNATLADPAGRPTDAAVQEKRLSDLVATWRAALGVPGLPFLMVQLPGYRRSWVEFRDAQSRVAAADADVHLAITLDVGDPTDVHPRDKAPVGDRLARLALRHLHGQREIGTGPWIAAVEFDRRPDVRVVVEGAEELRSGDGEAIRGFALAAADGIFRPARAELLPDRTLRVRAPGVTLPVTLRYAWQDDPRPNLVDGNGLPLAPHRTDQGPLAPRVRIANLAGLPERALEQVLGPDFKVGTFSGPRGAIHSESWEPDLAVIRSTDAWDHGFPAVRWDGPEIDPDLDALAAAASAAAAQWLSDRKR
ncbi:MAG: hypothetical protein O2865_05125 [Planctomycetota bacterium]|nr:hypothetical protein [Planctomycetota bacterium]MDA0932015.1 hypothetical protein [Planctomycetota bacterium]